MFMYLDSDTSLKVCVMCLYKDHHPKAHYGDGPNGNVNTDHCTESWWNRSTSAALHSVLIFFNYLSFSFHLSIYPSVSLSVEVIFSLFLLFFSFIGNP